MSYIRMLVLALLALGLSPAGAQTPSPEDQAMIKKLSAILDSLHPQFGDVQVKEADAVLRLGKDYYFLPANEAKRVIVEGWGNPPETATNVLGLVFPAGKTFMDDVWGAVITYDATGYVSDDDARTEDYGAIIEASQSQEEELNAERTKQGFPAQHLVGWAQPPSYDEKRHSLVWAQNIQFAGQADNSLNYDVRLLGRRGVLSLNLVSSMSKLPEVRADAAKFASAAQFNAGARYADFNAATDAKADFGIGGLVAAGVGVAAAKKLGLFAILLAFGKKFFVLILAGGVALVAWGRKAMARRRDPDAEGMI